MTNFSMQETQRILVKCKNSLYCNQPYVKEACRQLFWALDEIVNLRRQVTELEQKVVESNHRNLDLQYMVDSDALIMEKQKAALKVLGTRSGQRGKALVDARQQSLAHYPQDFNSPRWEELAKMAREQLAREGTMSE